MTTYALDPAEVQVGTANGPGLYIAPEKTPAPADTSAPWPAPWQVLGYLSDDGPTVGTSTDTEDIKPWQSRSAIRTIITGRQMTLQFVLWQLNELTLGLYFDTDPPVPDPDTGALKMQVRSDSPQHLYALGLDTADGDNAMRIVFHRASLSNAGDMQLQRGAAVPLDCTLTALDDAGVLADILLGPSGSGAGTTVTVTNPGPQTTVVDIAAAPLAIAASSTGGGALTYAATGLPAGLAIAPDTGIITGTPTAVETANVDVTVTDSASKVGSAAFVWDITATAGTRNAGYRGGMK